MSKTFVLELFFGFEEIFSVGAVVALFSLGIVVYAASAHRLQTRYNRVRKAAAERAADKGTRDAVSWFTLARTDLLLFPPFVVLFGPLLMLRALVRSVLRLFRSQKGDDSSDANDAAPPTWLAATLGPSFLFASGATVIAFILAEMILKPLLFSIEEIPTLEHAINAWLFQNSIYGGPFLSMNTLPATQLMLAGAFWLNFWWLLGFIFRLVHYPELGALQPEDVNKPTPNLLFWRKFLGAPRLSRPDRSFLRWAAPTTSVLIASAIFSMFMVTWNNMPLRAAPFSVGLFLVIGWGLHVFLLRGDVQGGASQTDERVEAPVDNTGWPDVAHILHNDYGWTQTPARSTEPAFLRGREPITDAPAPPLAHDLSPLLTSDAIVPHRNYRLSRAQHQILQKLQRDVAPVHRDTHTLQTSSLPVEHPLHEEAPSLHVSAADGAGKTTLGRLAAIHHVLRRGQPVLFIASSAANKDATYRAFQQSIQETALRWSIRLEKTEQGLINDASAPDILVTDLEWIAHVLLLNQSYYRELIESIGLIVVDDAQHYIAARSEHAGLIFGRLNLAFYRTEHALGGVHLPAMLALDNDTSIDALRATESFTYRRLEKVDLEPQSWARYDGSSVDPRVDAARCIRPLQDFSADADRQLTPNQLIDACEKARVPWFWHHAGDDLDKVNVDPFDRVNFSYRTASALDAAVVFVSGRYTHVQRTMRAMAFAGCAYLAEQADPQTHPVTLIPVVDDEEQMAFEFGPRDTSIRTLFETLPLPIVRAPSLNLREAHLSAELREHPIELDEIRKYFGNDVLLRIRDLLKTDRVQIEAINEIAPDKSDFIHQIYVRATARASQDKANHELYVHHDGEDIPLLRAPIATIARYTESPVRLFDPEAQALLGKIDSLAAQWLLYPGAIIRTDAIETNNLHDAQHAQYWRVSDDGPTPRESTTEEGAKERHVRRVSHTLSVPERLLTWRYSDNTSQEPAWERHFLGGSFALSILRAPLIIQGKHTATRLIDDVTFDVKQRQEFEGNQQDVYVSSADVAALAIDLEDLLQSLDSAWVDATLSLLCAAARMAIHQLYPDVQPPIDVSIMSFADAERTDNARTAPASSLVIFDIQEGGSGVLNALSNENITAVLRLIRLTIERVIHHGRLLSRYSDRPVSHHRGHEELRAQRYQEEHLRRALLTWLNARLPAEFSLESPTIGSEYPSAIERSDDPHYAGRAWIASTRGVSDLRWTRLHWRDLTTGLDRSADVGLSQNLLRELNETQHETIQELSASLHPQTSSRRSSDSEESSDTPKKKGVFQRIFGWLKRTRNAPASEDASAPPSATRSRDKSTSRRSAATRPSSVIEATLHGYSKHARAPHSNAPSTPALDVRALQDVCNAILEQQISFVDHFARLFERKAEEENARSNALHAVLLSAGLLEYPAPGMQLPVLQGIGLQPDHMHGPALTLHHGRANALSAALLAAALQRCVKQPHGIFVRVHPSEPHLLQVYAGVNIGPATSTENHDDVPSELTTWRKTMLHRGEDRGRSLEHVATQPAMTVIDRGDRIVAVNLERPRQLTLTTAQDLGVWHYIPLSEEQV